MFLLDTNVISELRKHGDRRAHPRVSAWVEQVDADSCYVSAITLLELELGILLLERRGDGKQSTASPWGRSRRFPRRRWRRCPPRPSRRHCRSRRLPQ